MSSGCKLEKAVNSYCTQANKLTTLKKSLEEANPKQKQDPQHSASLQAVEYYESQVTLTKNKWLEVLPGNWAAWTRHQKRR